MEISLNIKLNEKLYIRNPEESELGKKILNHSILLIHELGFEKFTFKKLAKEIGTTETGVYRYFENKHRLLIYIVDWYWSWVEYQIIYETKNIIDPNVKLKKVLKRLSDPVEDDAVTLHIRENLLYEIVMMEGAKSYLTRHVQEDDKNKLFQPYKDVCARVANLILECNPNYKHPRSLASTIIEMAHSHNFYVRNLPSLIDIENFSCDSKITSFLEDMVFSTIKS